MLTQKKLLLVDEDEGVRKALSLFFESHHCHLSTFENATQALIALEKEPYDVIICEEFLADMDGMDFFDILCKRQSEAIKILITSYGKNKVYDDLHGKGIDYLLMKPISGEEMERTMVRLLKSRHLDNGLKSTGRQSHSKQEKEKIMVKTDVLIVGGGAAGLVAAITGISHYPDKDFLLVRKEKQVLVPCGIPYIFGSLENSDQDILPDTMLINAGVSIRVGEVFSVDPEEKVCVLADGTRIGFEKLVLALGSTPMVPQWLKGRDLENVFTIPKDKEYLDHMLGKLRDHHEIVTIGGGFIGVEVSSELNKKDKNVTIVEILPNIMSLVFDTELSVKAEGILQKSGVTIKTGIGAQEIVGNGKVSGVLLSNGTELAADAVVLSVGYHPNTSIAEKAGLNINENGFIVVDEYMRTENPDIFAVGDCAEKRDFFTRKPTAVMLASTACAEARIAGMNLYKLSTLKTFNGTLAIFSTDIEGVGFGAAGLSESKAKHEGFDIVVGRFEGLDKHPGTLANTHKQFVKLIASRDGGVIVGGEVIGGPSIGELTNLIGFTIENRMTINSIITSQIGTHPLLTASPAGYPLIKAAEIAARDIL